jgi:hypothetical protein
MADLFPKEVASWANAALNVLHIVRCLGSSIPTGELPESGPQSLA